MADGYLLEAGTDRLLLEDGSGIYELDVSPYLVPVADGSLGAWVDPIGGTADLFEQINDGPVDDPANYVTTSSSNTTAEFDITTPPGTSTALDVHIEYSLDDGGGADFIIASLVHNNGSPTVVWTTTLNANGLGPFTLSGPELAAYNALVGTGTGYTIVLEGHADVGAGGFVFVYNVLLTQTLGAAGGSHAQTVNDGAGITDNLAKARGPVLTDLAGITDSLVKDRGSVITDVVGLVDTATPATGGGAVPYAETVNDSAGITDNLARDRGLAVTDSAGISDSVVKDRGLAVTDLVGITDSLVKDRGVTVNDNAGVTDTATPAAGAGHTQTVNDNAGITDAIVKDRAAAITDSAGITDALVKDRGVTVTDGVGVTDALVRDRNVTVNDTAGVTDSLVVSHTSFTAFTVTITDLVGLADTTTTTAAWTRIITDLVGLTDAAAATSTNARWLFRTPTYNAGGPWPRYAPRDVGIAVLYNDGTFTRRKHPLQEELLAADAYWLGGRENIVTDPALAALLIADGYELVLL